MRVVNVLFAKTFTLLGSRVENHFCSTRYSQPFHAVAGELVRGTVVSTQPIDFYVVSVENLTDGGQLACWPAGRLLYGGAEYGGAIVQWTVPTPGRYLFFFMNVVYSDASVAAYLTLSDVTPT